MRRQPPKTQREVLNKMVDSLIKERNELENQLIYCQELFFYMYERCEQLTAALENRPSKVD